MREHIADHHQSAGPTIKKAAYGVGLIGLAVTACLYLHVSDSVRAEPSEERLS
jgi:hypothetical protein